MRSRATIAWAAYLGAALALALYAVVQWLSALANRVPVLYGEGAVANAARLARDGIAYLDPDPSRFVAANYPPLYFHLSSIIDPFITGRIASIVATLAVALTALAVVLLDRRRELAPIAGFALVFAALAKPTALLPAAALVAWLAWSDRATLVRCGFGAAVAVVAAAVTVYLDSVPDVWRHVVTWNALSWSADQAVSVAFIGVLVVGVPLGIAAFTRGVGGARAAYLAGALAIVVLGGREGATINYLLDLTVATALSLAAVAPRLRPGVLFPVLALAQLVLGTAIVDPLRVVPGRVPLTGSWGDPSRAAIIAPEIAMGEPLLVEDSGLLVARGVVPTVDDLFMWSRLVERGTIDASPILSQVASARFHAVVSEADLEHLDAAPGFERQRWTTALARAVVERYRLDRHEGPLWIYVPR